MKTIPAWSRFLGWTIDVFLLFLVIGLIGSRAYASAATTAVLGASLIPPVRFFFCERTGIELSLWVRTGFLTVLVILVLALGPDGPEEDTRARGAIGDSANDQTDLAPPSSAEATPDVELFDSFGRLSGGRKPTVGQVITSSAPGVRYKISEDGLFDAPIKTLIKQRVSLFTGAPSEAALTTDIRLFAEAAMERFNDNQAGRRCRQLSIFVYGSQEAEGPNWIARVHMSCAPKEINYDIDERKLAALTEESKVMFGLSLDQRKKCYFELLEASQRARIESRQNYPDGELLVGGFERQNDYRSSIEKRYKTELLERYRVTSEQGSTIWSEGQNKGWPGPSFQPTPKARLLIGARYTLHEDAEVFVSNLRRTLSESDWFEPVAFENVLGSNGYSVRTEYGEGWFNEIQLVGTYGKLTRTGAD